jgi:hypothetical protein
MTATCRVLKGVVSWQNSPNAPDKNSLVVIHIDEAGKGGIAFIRHPESAKKRTLNKAGSF